MASKNIPVNGWPQLKDLEAVQPTLDRLDKIEAWKKTVKEETFTGSELTIDQALKLPARSLKTTIEAIQDLHGLPFPYVGGAYKNKCNINIFENQPSYFTQNGDGTVTQLQNDGRTEQATPTLTLPAGTYIISRGTTSGWFNVSAVIGGVLTDIIRRSNNENETFTITETLELYTKWSVGGTYPLKIYPMVRLATESDATFAPYSNICPIIGRTEARVDDVGKNILDFKAALDYWGADYTDNGNGSYTITRVGSGYSNPYQFATSPSVVSLSAASIVNLTTGGNWRIDIYDETNEIWLSINSATLSRAGVNANKIRLNYSNHGDGATITKVQIETGSTATPYEPYAHSSATIQLGQTVYGADINWDTGVMTITDAGIDLGSLEWTYHSDDRRFNASLSNIKNVAVRTLPMKCSCYEVIDDGTPFANLPPYCVYNNGAAIAIHDARYTDAETFITAVTGQSLVYPLAAPTTLQLTPTQLQMLKGYNRVSLADGYGTIELKALTGANWS